MLSTSSTYWIASALLATVVSLSASDIKEPTSGEGEPSAEPYAFSYSADSVGGYSDRQETGDASGRVQGFYTMMGDDGRMRRVDYVADENGYRASVSTNEVGTRSGPTGDAMYTVSQPSAGQLQAARVSNVEYAALESPHLLAASMGSARMTLSRDDDSWRSRLRAKQPESQQQQVQQQAWRVASRTRASSPGQDVSMAQETNQAVLSYQQNQGRRRVDTRQPSNNVRSNLKLSDAREMWSDAINMEQQQQNNVVDSQDQLDITTTAPLEEPQMIVFKSEEMKPLPIREQIAQTQSPILPITPDQEQVDVMIKTSKGAIASTTTTTTTEQPTTIPTTTTAQEQEQPSTTTQNTIASQTDNQQEVTQEMTTTTKQLQKTPSAPATTPQAVVTRTSEPELTTESPTTTSVAKSTRQPVIVIETNRAALKEEPQQKQQWQMNRISSVKGSSWSPTRGVTRTVQQVKSPQTTQERSNGPILIQVPVVQQSQQQVGSVQATKGGSTKTGSRQQSFWRARMLRNGQVTVPESTGFGARRSALN